jgi:hypothetical protein
MNYLINFIKKSTFRIIKLEKSTSIEAILQISDLSGIISEFLGIRENISFLSINKYSRVDQKIRYQIRIKINLVKKYLQLWKEYRIRSSFKNTPFPKLLINLFPILPWKIYYEGFTGYIDNIRINDMKSPIMIGMDNFRRPYICIKYVCPEWRKDSPLSDGSKYCFVTIFQRYSDNKKTWVKCREKGPILSCHANSTFSKEDYEYLISNMISLVTSKKIMFEARLNGHSWDIGTKMMECITD